MQAPAGPFVVMQPVVMSLIGSCRLSRRAWRSSWVAALLDLGLACLLTQHAVTKAMEACLPICSWAFRSLWVGFAGCIWCARSPLWVVFVSVRSGGVAFNGTWLHFSFCVLRVCLTGALNSSFLAFSTNYCRHAMRAF